MFFERVRHIMPVEVKHFLPLAPLGQIAQLNKRHKKFFVRFTMRDIQLVTPPGPAVLSIGKQLKQEDATT